jgi:putative peptidoglycan lipid II flippase
VGAVTSYSLLSRRVGGLAGRRLLRFLVRLAIAVGISAAIAWGLRELLTDALPGTSTWHAVLDLAVVGVAYLASYLALARLLRISEVNEVMALVTRRLRGRR